MTEWRLMKKANMKAVNKCWTNEAEVESDKKRLDKGSRGDERGCTVVVEGY